MKFTVIICMTLKYTHKFVTWFSFNIINAEIILLRTLCNRVIA